MDNEISMKSYQVGDYYLLEMGKFVYSKQNPIDPFQILYQITQTQRKSCWHVHSVVIATKGPVTYAAAAPGNILKFDKTSTIDKNSRYLPHEEATEWILKNH